MSTPKEQLKNLVEKSRDEVKRYDADDGTIDFGNMTGNDVFNTPIGDGDEQKLPWSTEGYQDLTADILIGDINGGHNGKYPSTVNEDTFWGSLHKRVNKNTGESGNVDGIKS